MLIDGFNAHGGYVDASVKVAGAAGGVPITTDGGVAGGVAGAGAGGAGAGVGAGLTTGVAGAGGGVAGGVGGGRVALGV